jgi:hypothetical protein
VIVPRARTPVPLDGLLIDLHSAGHEVLGTCPGVDACAVAWAQLVHEHARDAEGRLRGIWNYNFGNRDAPRALVGSSIAVFESVLEHEDLTTGPARVPHLRFAYADAYTGLLAWWAAMRDRWDAVAEMTDPKAFARALKRDHYYTGPESAYAARLAEYEAEALRMWTDLHAGRNPGES